jgi:hypothetical protein
VSVRRRDMFKITFSFSQEDMTSLQAHALVGRPLCKDRELIGEILSVKSGVSLCQNRLPIWEFQASINGGEEAYKSFWVPGTEGMAIGATKHQDPMDNLKDEVVYLDETIKELETELQGNLEVIPEAEGQEIIDDLKEKLKGFQDYIKIKESKA